MGQKAEYRSALRSRRLIREAYLQLLKEKGSGKITVTSIVNRADINRTTFYAHYPDVQGVLDELENEIIEKMLDFLGQSRYDDFIRDPLPLLRSINSYLEENAEFFRILVAANEVRPFIEKLKDIFAEYMVSNPAIPAAVRGQPVYAVRCCYFSGGLLNLYQQWLFGKLDCSLEDVAAEAARLIAYFRDDLAAPLPRPEKDGRA